MRKANKTRSAGSAGLLPYRLRYGDLHVFIVHMGGPLWQSKKRDWSMVKGDYEKDEDPFAAACRGFLEQTGNEAPNGPRMYLGEIVMLGRRPIRAWAISSEFDPSAVRTRMFTIEWPPGSGKQEQFPEIDRTAWVNTDTARKTLLNEQVPLLGALELITGKSGVPPIG